ncbi:DUF6701 domain-containing protein [Vibrio parahaemolyticus]|uniref:DUF6701 domain-containing protein n=1 Tax=Vibrio parahaemolyticus TaxID=670 RepID=UPI001B82E039|nr:DUF6701 domain-containing protein [Vibrio parahaemolyticus]MDF5077554.1 MSHA biogenesis protein MshQ [Vibrio parahaemolyticus]MDF5414079.1 MSHA biogenesis protein MshQ [Vibrio parahaemolyticus]MDF5424383.1 MSHA biogenesis protein MshQ [Vibrio parahaemolyticus]HBC3863576.1 MSHA biogenesis protein MshQ [Vibrio parahaemolyticus]
MKKIISVLVINSFLLFSLMVHASQSDEPKFEFGTVNCSVQSNSLAECVIHFENTYDEPPLVFVMSSIDSSLTRFLDKNGNTVIPDSSRDYYKKVKSAETEYPSDLRVWSVGKESSVIKQVIAPHAKACKRLSYLDKNWKCKSKGNYQIPVKYVNAPMTNIDYLVIEPGEISFTGGAKISAGYVDADLTTSKATGQVDFHTQEVNYNSRFDSGAEPGVLVQIQTRNNNQLENNISSRPQDTPLWLTAIGYEPNNRSFELILDRSEVSPNRYNDKLRFKERVAYVAGLGEGYYERRKFWLGQGKTQNTLDSFDDNLIRPVSDGCTSDEAKNYFNNGVTFTKAPVFLASKKLRKGNNGGWLRRCHVERDGVYLINEEDMNSDYERGHVLEEFSYFLFEKPPVDDVCELFRSPVQTWKRYPAGNLNMNNHAFIRGAELINNKRYVGFDDGHVHVAKDAKCDDKTCSSNPDLMVEKQTLESFREPSDPALNLVTISGKHGTSIKTFSNNEVIGTLNVEEKGKVIFRSGTYWVGNINVNKAGEILIPSGQKVTIHTKRFWISNQDSFVGELDGGQLMMMVHYSSNSEVSFSNHIKFSGLLYSEVNVPLSNFAEVSGAITAPNITMHNHSKVLATDNHCFTPSDNYEVTLSPVTQYALMCGTEQPEFDIQTKNDSNPESTGVTVQISPDSDKFSVDILDNTGSGSYPKFTTSNVSSKLGKLKLAVTVKDLAGIKLDAEYTLKVTVDNDSAKTQTSTFKFVPFKFDVSGLPSENVIVAGNNYDVDTRVLACSDGQQTVVKSYTGSPSVQLEIETPADGCSDESLLTYEPKFIGSEQGKTSDTFKLMDSGLYTIKLEDANFTCDPQYSDGCPIAPDEEKGEQESVTLNGLFSVKSRPWKIAACNIVAKNGGKTNPATQATGDGFIASAESFNVTYKAVVHSDSGGNANNVCEYPLTQNYFSDSNTAAPLDAEFSVLYPSGGDIANLDSSKGSRLDFSSEEAKAGKTVEYVWNEVGSLNLKTKATYLGMELDEYDVTVGRFYPKYFKVVDSSWTYPESQSFAYMNQPFDAVEFSVEALNANKAAIKNYANFSTKAEFNLDDIEHYSGRFDAPDFGAGSWSNESDKSIGDFSISNSGQCIGSACWNKDLGGNYPDGPFNSVIGTDKSQIGLIYTYNADPVEFITDGDSNSRLVKQPDIRFGRVDLDDVGGNQGTTLRVPLRVEYWNGSRFIANSDDSQTRVLGETEDGSQVHIWPTDNTAKVVSLGAGGLVSSGYSHSVTATEAESYRQQTRVWLDLESGGNSLPWLKYNWDNKNAGEENPSSVVTFGIHRGNDRVIYRGEPGLTGQ